MIWMFGFCWIGWFFVLIMYVKFVVFGEFWWYDEGVFGYVEDVFGFRLVRFWILLVNFI